MRNIKPRAKYQSVSLTEDFITMIKKRIINDPEYKSIAEYVRDAIREKIERDKPPIRLTAAEVGRIRFEDKREDDFEKRFNAMFDKRVDEMKKKQKKSSSSNGHGLS